MEGSYIMSYGYCLDLFHFLPERFIYHHKFLYFTSCFRTIWRQTRQAFRDQIGDIHTRIMKKNYAEVPQWWFYAILICMVALAIATCEGFGNQLQLKFWGVLLAAGLALLFTLPIGIITATTNQVCPSLIKPYNHLS